MGKNSGLTASSLVGVALALVLSGCGAGETKTESASSDQTDACVEKAQAMVEKGRTPMEPDLGPAFDVAPLKGKTVWFISPDQAIPYVKAQSEAVQEAAEKAGVTLKIFDGKSTPSLFNQGLETAVSQGADGVLLNSIDPSLVPGPLDKAKAAGVPVVDMLVGLPSDPVPDGLATVITPDAVEVGNVVAADVLARTECDADTLHLSTTVFPFVAMQSKGVESTFKELCSWCKLETVTVDPTKLATTVGQQVTNALQRDPDINSIIPSFVALIPYVIPAVEAKGEEIPISSTSGTPADFDQIRDGETNANVTLPPAAYFGYLQFDAMLRAMADAPQGPNELPIQLIDESNVGESSELESLFPGLAGYQDEFAQVWGLS
jgi:ribose transport system substrate-binding protein